MFNQKGFSVKKFWISFILAAVLLYHHGVEGKDPSVPEGLNDIIAKIQATYEKINDLQSEFVQSVQIVDFDTPYVSKGQLFLKKGKMRWDYREPSKQQIFVDGERFLYYVPEHRQVIRSRLGGQSDGHLPLRLLSGAGRLDQDFQISFEGESKPAQKSIVLRLIPKKEMELTKIVLTVVPSPQIEGWMIQKVALYEANGNISTSSFEGIQINKGVSDDLFTFKIPKGVEVIDTP
jgi:outer membrane lipoprotein carrier protein